MSWYRDPQLFIYDFGLGYRICRVKINLSIGATFGGGADISDDKAYSFSNDLYFGTNKESDYDVFFSDLKKRPSDFNGINCQGWVFSGPSDHYVISREHPDSPFYSLPGVRVDKHDQQKADDEKVRALEKKVSDLETTLAQEKNDKEALQKEISELTKKLEESCGVGGGSAHDEQPWITGHHPFPSNWVSYDDLDVLWFPKDTPLKTHKVMWVSKLAEDNTTNVQPHRFHLGVFPIVAVNVAELIPDNENARFDPEFWGLYRFAGTTYAAPKPFETEMLVDTKEAFE